MEHQPRHQRPAPRVPEPIEFDPFEMDWPWPGMATDEAPAEPAASELPSAEPAPEPEADAVRASIEQDAAG